MNVIDDAIKCCTEWINNADSANNAYKMKIGMLKTCKPENMECIIKCYD